jgi:hypothetical protein
LPSNTGKCRVLFVAGHCILQIIFVSRVENRMGYRKNVLFGSACAVVKTDVGKESCRPPAAFWDGRFTGKPLFIIADWQNKVIENNIFRLSNLFGISRNTINRWIIFFQDVFPFSRQWQRIRGRVQASVKSNKLPASLINHFLHVTSSVKEALVSCLKFLSGSFFCQKIRAD